jgi:hypothetical protein
MVDGDMKGEGRPPPYRIVGREPSYDLSTYAYAGLMFMMGIRKHIHQLGGW